MGVLKSESFVLLYPAHWHIIPLEYLFHLSNPSMAVTCWNLPLVPHTLDPFQIFCRSRAIWVIGSFRREITIAIAHLFVRRDLIRKHLKSNETPFTIASFPRLGARGIFTEPQCDPKDAVSSHSLFLPEEITNPHARFPFVYFHLTGLPGSWLSFGLQDSNCKYQTEARI